MVLLAEDDEVIDHRNITSRDLKAYEVVWFKRGGHSFEILEEALAHEKVRSWLTPLLKNEVR